MSFYIDEETRTRFKLACTATGTSMNQVLVEMVHGWLDENDPFKKQPPSPATGSNTKGSSEGGRGKDGEDL